MSTEFHRAPETGRTPGGPLGEVITFPRPGQQPAGRTTVTEVPDQPGEPVEGEVVEAPRRVDALAPHRPGWMETHQARLAEAPAVIPSYLRNRQEFTDNARFIVEYYARMGAYQATRSPIYLLRLVGRSPRGIGRLLRRWLCWLNDVEAKPVLAHAAGSGDPAAWMQLVATQTKRTRARRNISLAVGAPAALAVVAAVVLLPSWAVGAGLVALLAALGLAGSTSTDKPIIDRWTSPQFQRELTSDEVVQAIEALGVKGRVDFVNPIQTDGPGWRAEIDLPPGHLAERVLEERAKLAAAMRRPLTTVWPESDPEAHPGRLVLWVAKKDPARSPRRLWPLMTSGQTNLFEDIPFGFNPRGQVVGLNLMYTNLLMGGVPGSGKTSGVMVVALAGALDPHCEMWVYEMKGSGDLDPVQPVCHRYVSGDDDEHCASGLDALRKLEKELKRRKEVIAALPPDQVPKGRKVYPHLAKRKDLGLHPLLAVFDEAHTLFEHEEFGKEAADIAGRLIRKARAYGIILVITTQRPDAKSLPKVISDNVSTRFCLAVTGQQANDMVLGTSMYKNGVRATMFDPKKEAGTGWLAKSSHDTQIVRAAFIEQAEAIEIGKRALALRTAAGTLTGEAAGQAIEPEDTTTVIDHLVAVWPTGEDTMHSVRLVEALAAYRPETYGPWIQTDTPVQDMDPDQVRAYETRAATMLSAALKPFGVHTGQITKRGAGGSRKGVKRADLQAAVGRAAVADEDDQAG
ncbi:S-DNA-T family DNA segregation ATPase FtsK/SpoIIIE [Streptomonospora nanhaiensis]|uniref:S-DNA-T family DNA segregation ATPase FtsK/SpoIIIE n=1 Tax=Streptomonospora nanhaiensis TaxID=1323731 RepID=A0A853BK93_9ACTN|nr:FtsK/SpoIIIE domain-containing protein [Streptomonospora nanhaiensis]NYI95909.1 S-DNA-T family DNA segregation ATPase FtsK/SpoIIIE [Streptomonospora nanhaiensis]